LSFNEARVIDVIRDVFAPILAEGARGLKDDGAWLPPCPRGHTRVVSLDAIQEERDFSTRLAPLKTAGFRAIVQNLSDLAAMGAKPVGFVWHLAIPKRWLKQNARCLKEFCEGALAACLPLPPSGRGIKGEGVPPPLQFYGGDLSLSDDKFSCAVTIFGDVNGKPLTRQGARAGDILCISHPVGESALGLQILQAAAKKRKNLGDEAAFEKFLQTLSIEEQAAVLRHTHPKAELDLGAALVDVATACVDISDGLAKDLHHLCGASQVGATLGASFSSKSLTSGEEYALLFTLPNEKALQKLQKKFGESGILPIGQITKHVGKIRAKHGNKLRRLAENGYDHFSS